MTPNEFIVQMAPMMADGEHKIVILTNRGRMFERRLDPRGNLNSRPGTPTAFAWVELDGPSLS